MFDTILWKSKVMHLAKFISFMVLIFFMHSHHKFNVVLLVQRGKSWLIHQSLVGIAHLGPDNGTVGFTLLVQYINDISLVTNQYRVCKLPV